MIMNNHLKFGYGDIEVFGVSMSKKLRFSQIKPPMNCGDTLKDISKVEYVGDPVYLSFNNLVEYEMFMSLLSAVTKDTPVFEFKGLIFDFSMYNAASVSVCKKQAETSMRLYQLALAC